MKKLCMLVILILCLTAACSTPAAPTATPETPPTPTPLPPTALPTTRPAEQVPPLPVERGDLFSASGVCTVCHTQMIDAAGNDVSTDTFWRASMMANSSRDPYWRASVRGEVISNPDYRAVIEDKCATCHTPMARFTATAAAGQAALLDDGFFSTANDLHALAIDGVSCNLCHQIMATNLGTPESYSGGYAIDTELPAGERLAYGPYVVGKNLVQIMQSASGFIPQQGLHVEESELCATCHTLYTPYVDEAGQIAGEFPEQMPYLEWLHSDYAAQRSCQSCHMPPAQGGVRLSITGGPQREPFYQHTFVGGNAYMLSILGAFGQDMAVTASKTQFADKAERIVEQLQQRTATVAVEAVTLSGSELTAQVVVESAVGHKFPSGFPARRAWLHLMVQDAAGQVVFESGAVQPSGAIVGNNNDTDPAAYEPHYQEISASDQVQIYEAIMEDTMGRATTTLLRGAGYAKDNRLLPLGFDKATADADIGVYGGAAEDEDFLGGKDVVLYRVDVGDAQGPFTVTARLLYQSIGYRWADNLRRYDSPESQAFLSYYDTIPNLPALIASATVQTE
ncbi:MAG: hypothetical protein ACOYZ7_00120 [Chloroflexota bacterium]